MLTEVWSPQQAQAIESVQRWLDRKNRPQVYRLFGFAGTGKTTLAKYLAATAGNVLYACFTGKAALVLRKKGCYGASTIHILIYKAHQDPNTGKFIFSFNYDSPLRKADLLVVDEVSMVNEELAMDLLRFNVPILVLGDPAQLPPVKGEGYFINAEPDSMLTEVHRQAQDNPIIKMSMDVRAFKPLALGEYGDSSVISRDDLTDEMLITADQVLCGTNRNRVRLNKRIRELKGLYGKLDQHHPTEGDRLVCLRNNREKGLLNGGLWDVRSVDCKRSLLRMDLDSADQPGISKSVVVPEEFFFGTEENLNWRDRKNYDEFTFGATLTVHKAQGSQWDNVVLFDDSAAFGDKHVQWMYTGITRAAESIHIVT